MADKVRVTWRREAMLTVGLKGTLKAVGGCARPIERMLLIISI